MLDQHLHLEFDHYRALTQCLLHPIGKLWGVSLLEMRLSVETNIQSATSSLKHETAVILRAID